MASSVRRQATGTLRFVKAFSSSFATSSTVERSQIEASILRAEATRSTALALRAARHALSAAPRQPASTLPVPASSSPLDLTTSPLPQGAPDLGGVEGPVSQEDQLPCFTPELNKSLIDGTAALDETDACGDGVSISTSLVPTEASLDVSPDEPAASRTSTSISASETVTPPATTQS